MEANDKATTAEGKPVEKRSYVAPKVSEMEIATNTKGGTLPQNTESTKPNDPFSR